MTAPYYVITIYNPASSLAATARALAAEPLAAAQWWPPKAFCRLAMRCCAGDCVSKNLSIERAQLVLDVGREVVAVAAAVPARSAIGEPPISTCIAAAPTGSRSPAPGRGRRC